MPEYCDMVRCACQNGLNRRLLVMCKTAADILKQVRNDGDKVAICRAVFYQAINDKRRCALLEQKTFWRSTKL
jgi:hypothetical protein